MQVSHEHESVGQVLMNKCVRLAFDSMDGAQEAYGWCTCEGKAHK